MKSYGRKLQLHVRHFPGRRHRQVLRQGPSPGSHHRPLPAVRWSRGRVWRADSAVVQLSHPKPALYPTSRRRGHCQHFRTIRCSSAPGLLKRAADGSDRAELEQTTAFSELASRARRTVVYPFNLLQTLHWLLVLQRMTFKITTLTLKNWHWRPASNVHQKSVTSFFYASSCISRASAPKILNELPAAVIQTIRLPPANYPAPPREHSSATGNNINTNMICINININMIYICININMICININFFEDITSRLERAPRRPLIVRDEDVIPSLESN